jgi:hypothetical protein
MSMWCTSISYIENTRGDMPTSRFLLIEPAGKQSDWIVEQGQIRIISTLTMYEPCSTHAWATNGRTLCLSRYYTKSHCLHWVACEWKKAFPEHTGMIYWMKRYKVAKWVMQTTQPRRYWMTHFLHRLYIRRRNQQTLPTTWNPLYFCVSRDLLFSMIRSSRVCLNVLVTSLVLINLFTWFNDNMIVVDKSLSRNQKSCVRLITSLIRTSHVSLAHIFCR